jgi:hypothetical protein
VSLFSKEFRPDIVLRGLSPRRRGLLRAVLLLAAAACLYGAFELGRYSAGYSVIAALRQRMHWNGAVERLEAANRSLRARLIDLETVAAARAREDQVVSRTIGDLQAQVANDTQELAFYRGVVASGAPAIGLRLAMVRFSSAKAPGSYTVHVSLVRAGLPDGMTSGSMSLTVEGVSATGTPATLDNATLVGGSADLPYSFRYYQDLEQSVTLPSGFHPKRVAVELRSSRKDVPPLTQTFPWSAVAAP